MNRAYARIDVKSFDDDKREFSGIASTPMTDRMGDIVEPKGAKFQLPMPFLWQHIKDKPVGHITSVKVTATGIEVKGKVETAKISTVLKERLDEAWESLKLGLVRGLSIGFKPIEHSLMDDGGIRFMKWDWLELSAVTIAANQEASITAIKSIDDANIQRAALGRIAVESVAATVPKSPGATGKPIPVDPAIQRSKGKPMNIREQIASFEAKRAATVARMEAITSKTTEEGRSYDKEEGEEFDTLESEIGGIDQTLVRLAKQERISVVKATPITVDTGKDPDSAAAARGGLAYGDGVMKLEKPLQKGVAFTRYATALMIAKGNIMQAREIAQTWNGSSPEVGKAFDVAVRMGSTRLQSTHDMYVKAAVAAGTTTDTTWANPLVQYNNMASEFVELLRPASIIGRIEGFRRVPFYSRIPRQTAGVTGQFVGEGLAKPLDNLAFDSITMEPFKAAVIVVITSELSQFSSPSAELLVRDDMVRGIAQFLDERFIDPQYTGNASSPASITNAATVTTATGSTIALTDAAVEAALGPFTTANMDPSKLVWLMSPVVALSLSMKRDAQDKPAYPGLSMAGGTWYGLPVIVSNAVALAGSPTEAYIVLMDPSSILMSDEGGIDIDMSTEASVQMSDTPSAGATSLVSLWQNNMVGLRAEKFINWKLRRTGAVAVIRYNLSPSGV